MKTVKAFLYIEESQFFLRQVLPGDEEFADDYPEFMIELSDKILENMRDLANMVDDWENCPYRQNFNVDKLDDLGRCIQTCCLNGQHRANEYLQKNMENSVIIL
jgi:hypothetical protein